MYTLRGFDIHNEFMVIIERDTELYIACCPEIPCANGQSRTKEECIDDLRNAIDLILEDCCKDTFLGIPKNAERKIVKVG